MSRPRVRSVFLGTPAAAVPALAALAASTEVMAVYTRPDKPRGRSGRPMPSPVKARAVELGIPVVEPANAGDLTETLSAVTPIDVGVVAAYGTLIRARSLDIPARGFLNVHFSLLPRWRGASPVIAAILAGDEETGVTLMHLDEGLDTGPIIAARAVVVGREETGGALTARLAAIGSGLLMDHIFDWVDGNLSSIPQSEAGATVATKLTKADRLLDLNHTARSLARRVRALAPAPGAVLSLADLSLLVLDARSVARVVPLGLVSVIDDRVLVGTSQGSIELLVVQPPSRRPMAAADWLRGHPLAPHMMAP